MGADPAERVFLADVRGTGRYLRVTWHRDSATVVFGHWVDDVCVASTRVGLNEASKLVGLLVGGLQELATPRSSVASVPSGPGQAGERSLLGWLGRVLRMGPIGRLGRMLRPPLAEVVDLAERLVPAAKPRRRSKGA